MPTGTELKTLARQRLKTAKFLLDAKEWDMAKYIMGYALECALKATICKTLHLSDYPNVKRDEQKHFGTHKFDILLRLAGLEDIFNASNKTPFGPWSDFTKEYIGDWTAMRYEPNQITELTAKLLFECLDGTLGGSEGIFAILSKKRRW